MKRTSILVLIQLAIAVIISAGCAPPFSKMLLDKVEKNLPFSELNKAPESHVGKIMMVGGTIVDTKNLQEGTQLEVLQRPLDGEGQPTQTDETGGRFLVVTSQFLDGAVYHRGRSVTIIGEVTGSQVQPLGELQYRYPVLTAKELHLWSPSSGPRFSIGVGMYRGF
jgi:outer membrane lipoprotein